MRFVWDRDALRVVPAAEFYARKHAPVRAKRSALPAPRLASDGCEFRSMADGQVYTSKAAYRADLRARGLEEVGNDSSLTRERAAYEAPADQEAETRLFDQLVGA